MNIVAIDDEKLALQMLNASIKEVCPNDCLTLFSKPAELLEYAKENKPDIAFLDIKMRGITGIELAKKLKDIAPKVNIIFVTGYDEYTGDAMRIHASGYIYKPVTPEKIKAEISDLRNPVESTTDKILRVKCFGNFDVFTPDGEQIKFQRSKSKEAFAYLISREGSSCTVGEIAGILLESDDSDGDSRDKVYTRKILSSMMTSLREYGVEAAVTKKFNSVSVNKDCIDCDYYRFLQGDVSAVNSYHGEFMAQYSWSEFITGYLENR